MKNNATKILKKIERECPDCGERGLNLISKKNIVNGVDYYEKLILCQICGYSTPFKEKKNHKIAESLKELSA